jgi:hypothetical protein
MVNNTVPAQLVK